MVRQLASQFAAMTGNAESSLARLADGRIEDARAAYDGGIAATMAVTPTTHGHLGGCASSIYSVPAS